MSGYHRLLTTLKNVSKEDDEEEEEDSVMDETEMNLEDGNSDISEENKWQQSLLTCRGVWPYLQTPREKMGMGHRAHQRNPPRSFSSVQFISVAQSCPTLCNPVDCSTPGSPCPSPTPRVHSNSCPLVSVAIQPSQPLLFLSPPAPNPSQHQGLFQ